MVVDNYGNGVPIASMWTTSSEAADELQTFLEKVGVATAQDRHYD